MRHTFIPQLHSFFNSKSILTLRLVICLITCMWLYACVSISCSIYTKLQGHFLLKIPHSFNMLYHGTGFFFLSLEAVKHTSIVGSISNNDNGQYWLLILNDDSLEFQLGHDKDREKVNNHWNHTQQLIIKCNSVVYWKLLKISHTKITTTTKKYKNSIIQINYVMTSYLYTLVLRVMKIKISVKFQLW